MDAILTPLEPEPGSTLADIAWSRLKRDIISGDRKPGERLRIERLRELYGIGASPLREALQRLSADGLVIAEGNRGFTVAPLDPDEFRDLTRARIAVEREALRLAIAQGGNDWEGSVVSASYLMAKADRETSPGTDAWEQANTTFHRAMVSACGSQWLLRVRDGLQMLAERYRRVSVGSARSTRDLGAEHRAISDAVLARDAETACALTTEHYSKTEEELRSVAQP
ncbi:GntR family transcriptional regulator [Roseivivax isoporae]|uniref:Transcriptional regulator n=1 Tax=Roseivivax isoporae LMG 25204 TaxID=1449351 RepID=X7F7L2_9RHOB|nr:FCD domain-containing protein [Roseivivax isoporae]ETX28056.1 transcriptional regulator [Roseivivax isoporae LMG 25204]